ncbi:hypothetical protein BJ875DRAFT_460036 [Amylocarpus encephaloides]|uniref:DOMON domain-containing protein n=1 Tax=Amylocarpus encephaloides TaxID=45428 RepID=A0A9P7YK76_9HELO|nr:hypothetical protein BJ875DRAFT_460036 [Amylocarpus encephaloides]
MVKMRSALAAAVAFLSASVAAVSFSGFASDLESIKFAINIPQEENSNALYFSMSAPIETSWFAVGMGGSTMKDSLMFMAYLDKSGKNMTLSPRLSYGQVEPSFTPDVGITILNGTEVTKDTMTVSVKCFGCRKWKGGAIDPTSTNAKFIWANGGVGAIKSNSKNAAIKRHGSYGRFQMDLTKAVGPGGAAPLNTTKTEGSLQISEVADRNFMSGAHACIMVFTFVGLMPIAVLLLRVANSPRLHGVVQAVSASLALVGLALGLKVGMMYNRTRKFNTAHQIIGLLVIIMMVGQFVLGFLHHRMFVKTKAPTKLAPIHIWLGRVVILAGTVNAFIGFPLALNARFDLFLLGIVLFMVILSGPLIFWRWRRNIQKAEKEAEIGKPRGGGYQSEPWRGEVGRGDVDLGNYPPPPQPMQPPPMYR